MKKFLSLCLLLLTTIVGWAQTTFNQNDFTYTVTDAENHYVSIARNNEVELSGELEIPSSVTYDVTYRVKSIAASGFSGSGITSVIIPASVTTIGNEAFKNTGLTSITIPASVTSIGDAAFQGCSSMTSITIADSETSLTLNGSWDQRPFANAATTIYIGRNLTLTGGDDNQLLDYATSVEFGPKVTTINPKLFYTNAWLRSITIGNGVTTIGNQAFSSCGTDENIDEMVVTMGSSVTTIGASAFQYSTKLKSVTLPSTLTTIGAAAFNYTGLTGITIPASVTSVGDAAFQVCNSMTSIRIEDCETSLSMNGSWDQRPFANAATTVYIGRNLTLTGDDNQLLDYATSVEFGPNVTTINPKLFHANAWLRSITIGNGVTTIGNQAFSSCGTDENIEEMVLTMGSSVTTIGASAFQYSSSLKSVALPSTLTTIGAAAFHYTGLTSIIIPSSVTSVGDAAFQACSSMTSIRFEDSETPLSMNGSWDQRPFANAATTIYIGRDLELTGDDDNQLLDYATSVEFGPQVTAIPSYLFSGVTLSSVKVPWLTPITLNATTFYAETYTNATLLVPGGTKGAYKAEDDDNGWKAFTTVDHWSTLVTLTASNHGSIVTEEATASNGTEQYRQPKNDAIIYTLNADTGYELTALTDNAAAVSPLPALGEAQTRTNTSGEEFVTLNATFSAINYTLEYELAGGSVASANPATYTIESTAITLNNPTREGYTFTGWTGTGLDAATTTVTIAAGSTGNRSYTATWTPTIYNIEYTMDGGTASPANPTTYTIETTTFTLTNPTKTGYTFKGWKLNGEGDALMTVTITQGSTGEKAYTATWQVNQYTITFNSDGGSAVDPITQDYGTTVTPPADPTKSGYDFAGWTPALPETMPAENMTVTAIWTKKTYTVSITGGGVTADNYSPEDGDNVVLTIMNDPDATLTSLTVNGTEVKESIEDNQYTITGVSGNVSVVATWSSTKEFVTLATPIATLSCSQDLNFTGSDLRAYIAAGYSKSENSVLLVRVYDVPANTGLVIRGEEGQTYKIPYSTSQSYFVNLLKAHLTTDDVPATSGDYYNYILKRKEGVYKWSHPANHSTPMNLGEKKAYLQLPTSFMTAGARELNLVFEDDSTTDISKFVLLSNGKAGDRIYNLNGQQVDNMRKGVYIVNGRKVMK